MNRAKMDLKPIKIVIFQDTFVKTLKLGLEKEHSWNLQFIYNSNSANK